MKLTAALAKLFAVLAWMGLTVACSSSTTRDVELFIENLTDASQALNSSEVLRMDMANRGKWDRMFVFGPYSPLSNIETAIKAKPSKAIIESRISERDDINLLVFMSGADIQIVAVVNRDVVDFSIPDNSQPLSRESAAFKRSTLDNKLVWLGAE